MFKILQILTWFPQVEPVHRFCSLLNMIFHFLFKNVQRIGGDLLESALQFFGTLSIKQSYRSKNDVFFKTIFRYYAF